MQTNLKEEGVILFCTSCSPLQRKRTRKRICDTAQRQTAIASSERANQSRRRVAKMLFAAAISYPLSVHSRIEGPELRGLEDKSEGQPGFRDLGSGVRVQEVASGTGTEKVEKGCVVGVKYVMRRSNGYFIDASYGFDRFETFSFRAGSGEVVPGFDIGLMGMQVGGRRRFVVPPEVGYVGGVGKEKPGPVPPDFGARRSLTAHRKEPIIFEVQVVRIRAS